MNCRGIIRHIGPLVLGVSIGVAALSWWPDISAPWRLLNTVDPPMVIPDAEAHWINDKQFDVVAPTYVWSDTCPTVWATWWLQTKRHGNVLAASVQAIKGPLKRRGVMPPNYKLSMSPTAGPPLHLRVTIPEWLNFSEVVMVAVDDAVPDNEPCESGWTGAVEVLRLQIN